METEKMSSWVLRSWKTMNETDTLSKTFFSASRKRKRQDSVENWNRPNRRLVWRQNNSNRRKKMLKTVQRYHWFLFLTYSEAQIRNLNQIIRKSSRIGWIIHVMSETLVTRDQKNHFLGIDEQNAYCNVLIIDLISCVLCCSICEHKCV